MNRQNTVTNTGNILQEYKHLLNISPGSINQAGSGMCSQTTRTNT